jgi:hypothetical protein
VTEQEDTTGKSRPISDFEKALQAVETELIQHGIENRPIHYPTIIQALRAWSTYVPDK